jgi:hypothetical protein
MENIMNDYSDLLDSLEELETFIKLDTGHPGAERVAKAKTAIETLTRELVAARSAFDATKASLVEAIFIMYESSRDCVEIGGQTYGRKPYEMRETPQWWKLQKAEEITRKINSRFRTFLAKQEAIYG